MDSYCWRFLTKTDHGINRNKRKYCVPIVDRGMNSARNWQADDAPAGKSTLIDPPRELVPA
jgi:hypothetical protein